MSDHWSPPEGGDHFVAIRSDVYEALIDEVDNFFGRPLAKDSHYYTCEGQTYAADAFMSAFEGEPFDPRDAGRGSHWMYWYRGKTAKRMKDRSPYNFRER